ncbi:hypothetical protein D4764_02G0008550 [Takifugu flavidus]|uniref:Uncharacterized protein n=1 Tax=Takifugu flavidus TaxID=433684 RepID=A0A5C6NKA2_9TELE|nr:hypothetical protein D4764_02G0008550 [Takifugu flavidus]
MPVGRRTGRKEAEGREGGAVKEEQVQCQFKGLIRKETSIESRSVAHFEGKVSCGLQQKDSAIDLYVAVSSSMGLEECVCLPTRGTSSQGSVRIEKSTAQSSSPPMRPEP